MYKARFLSYSHIMEEEKKKIKTPPRDLSTMSFHEVMNEWLSNPPSDLLSMFPREEKVDENL